MLTMYVLLDGFDLGAGAINLSVAKSDRERRIVLRSIGPVWDGNEVWIIAAGGTLFFSFPLLYASSFSGFYLPLIIVLWLLRIRGLSIELRGHIESPVWASFWDGMFFLGSTILTGLLALTTLVVHGANWVALKTENELNARARRAARIGWAALVFLTVLTTVATFSLSPEMLSSFAKRPWGVVFPALAVAGLALMGYFGFRRRDRSAFLSSGAYTVGMMASTAFAIYPNVLPAVEPENSLTVYNASGSAYGLAVGLAWWSIGMVLAAIYFVLIYRLFRGKVSLEDDGY